jgi:type IV secretion system protein VirD4
VSVNRRQMFRRAAGLAVLGLGLWGTYEAVWHLMRFWFGVEGISAWRSVWRYRHALSPGQKFALTAVQFAAAVLSVFSVMLALLVGVYRRKISTHGDARFATRAEIADAGFHNPVARGLLIGRFGNRFLYSMGKDWITLVAPPRSGKGVGVVVPNLLNYADSAVVIDIRGEAYVETSGYRRECGQDVFVWQPYSDDIKEGTKELQARSHRYNPCFYMGSNPATRVGDLRDIALGLIPDLGTENDFFRGGAREIFVAIGLYLVEIGRKLSVGLVRRYSQGNGTAKPLRVFLPELVKEADEQGVPLSERCRSLLRGCVGGAEETVGSYVQELEKALADWDNPIVVAATEENDFDFRDLRRKRMTIYVVIEPFKLPAATRLLNLFFSQLIGWNMRERPEDDPGIKYECLLMLDEFTAPGKITILSKAFGYMAGYGLKVVSICQHHGQIEEVYGKEITKSYLDSHAVTIVFPPRGVEQAEMVSRQLGNYTLQVESKSRSGRGGGVSVNESEMGRALLLPQELAALSLERPPAELIFTERALPIKCQRIIYYQDSRFQARKRPPVEIPLLDVDLAYDTPHTKQGEKIAAKVGEGDVAPGSLAEKYDPVRGELSAEEDAAYQAWERRRTERAALGAVTADREDEAFFAGLTDRLVACGVLQM